MECYTASKLPLHIYSKELALFPRHLHSQSNISGSLAPYAIAMSAYMLGPELHGDNVMLELTLCLVQPQKEWLGHEVMVV